MKNALNKKSKKINSLNDFFLVVWYFYVDQMCVIDILYEEGGD